MNTKISPISRRDFLRLAGTSTLAAAAFAQGLPTFQVGAQGGYTAPAGDITATLSTYNFGDAKSQVVYKAAIARFNQRYPNVKVEDNYFPIPNGDWAQYITQYKTRVASGLAPDILAMAIEGARLATSSGLLMPLDEMIGADPNGKKAFVDGVNPVLDNALKYQNKTYFITREWNNMMIHYNTQMFKAAGLATPSLTWTWDDFLAAAKKLTTGEGATKVYGFGIPFFNFGLQPWFYTNSTSQLTADWTASNLNDPKVLEAVKFVHSLIHEHGVAPAVEGTDQNSLFAANCVAMTGAGHWTVSQWADNKVPMDVTNWPRKTAATTVFGSGGWGIGAQSANPKLAWELLKDLANLATDKEIAKLGGSIPAREEATKIPEFQQFPPSAVLFYDSLKDIKPVPAPANFAEVQDIFMRHMSAIMSNQVTPEQGLADAHTELSDAMAKLKES